MGTIAALQLALASVLPAALLGGLIGGYIWRWFRVSGAFAALSVAWATGIIVLPIAASLLDVPLRTGIACFFSCEANLRDDQPFSGVEAYGSLLVGSIWFAFFTPLTVAFAVLARRWGSLLLAVFGAVMTHGLIHAWALVSNQARSRPWARKPTFRLVPGLLPWETGPPSSWCGQYHSKISRVFVRDHGGATAWLSRAGSALRQRRGRRARGVVDPVAARVAGA